MPAIAFSWDRSRSSSQPLGRCRNMKLLDTDTFDFILPNGILVNVVGFFSIEDRHWLLLAREQHPGLDIRLVFSRSASPLRKGAKSSCADWCRKHRITFADKLIPQVWLDEPVGPARHQANQANSRKGNYRMTINENAGSSPSVLHEMLTEEPSLSQERPGSSITDMLATAMDMAKKRIEELEAEIAKDACATQTGH